MPQTTLRVARKSWSRALFFCLLAGTGTACTQTTGQNAVYIVVPPARAAQFLDSIDSLSTANGLTPHFGQVKQPQGFTLHLLEASGWRVTLWLRNVPLSGDEDPRCGYHGVPYPDPAQFLMYAEPRFFWVGQETANAMQGKLVEGLKTLGYTVRSQPAVCGNLASRGE